MIASQSTFPKQQFLNFLPVKQGQGSLRFILDRRDISSDYRTAVPLTSWRQSYGVLGNSPANSAARRATCLLETAANVPKGIPNPSSQICDSARSPRTIVVGSKPRGFETLTVHSCQNDSHGFCAVTCLKTGISVSNNWENNLSCPVKPRE
jgi:hypothetical protein